MRKRSGVLKVIFIGLLLVSFISISVFTIAGMLPVKNNMIGIRKSTYVTMKDGTKIAVRYTLPDNVQKAGKIPVVMECTRYGTSYEYSFALRALINLRIAKERQPVIIRRLLESGYAFVEVESRGTAASFGTRDMEWQKEEIEDMGQVIDWITKQSWSNGKVGTYGMSYSGNTAELSVALNNPALLAAAPLYSDFDPMAQGIFPGGIFNEYLVKNYCEGNIETDTNKKNFLIGGVTPVDEDKDGKILKEAVAGHNTVDLYEALKNMTYFDDIISGEYTGNSLAPFNNKDKIEKSNVPLYVRVGWLDSATVNGAIERFLTYRNRQTLVIGPWNHAGRHFSDPLLLKQIPREELEGVQADEMISFFDIYLKEDRRNPGEFKNEIRYYTFGEGKWKITNTWPVAGFDNKRFYFDENGGLTKNKPSKISGKDIYKVDYTASTGETNRWRTNLGAGPIVYPDRAEEDKKLLTYTSEALENDIEITGIPVVTLNLSSTDVDGAFFTYLEDVAPDGKVVYITEGELRALHRKVTGEDLGHVVLGPKHSFRRKDGEQLKPGENTELKIGMYATSVMIKKGHKIRVAIAGQDASNFRRVPGDSVPTIQIQRNSMFSSHVELPMKIRN